MRGTRGTEVERLDAFDGLRACAAVSVIAYHACWWANRTKVGAVAPVLAELKAGVAVFFVISGFLLYLPYARAIRDRAALPDWRAFAQRRFVRIVPAYWVALAVLALGPLSSALLTPDWWRYWGFAQIYDLNTYFSGIGVAWSLCVEVTFYASLPALAAGISWAARRSECDAVTRQILIVAGLAALSLVLRIWECGSPTSPVVRGEILAGSLPGMFDWFALGIGLAVIRAEWEAGRATAAWIAALARNPARCWLCAAILFGLAIPLQGGDIALPAYGLAAHILIGLGATALVLPAIPLPFHARRARGQAPLALLTNPTVAWIGTVSYGVYLWHEMVLRAFARPLATGSATLSTWTTLGLFAATVAGAIVLGAASWYLVERPAQRRWRPRRPVPVAAVG
jgi:peptidoglycan/LPS O-acetylase OafA/YrhL